jgi:hypothetical protein
VVVALAGVLTYHFVMANNQSQEPTDYQNMGDMQNGGAVDAQSDYNKL